MSLARVIRVVAVVVALGVAKAGRGAEPWADAKLAPTAGLELWLDAGREHAARAALGLSKLQRNDSLSEWHDASGWKRHVMQNDPKKQPTLRRFESADASSSQAAWWVVSFDGVDDHLHGLCVNRRLTDFTLFVAAAPYSNLGDFRGFFAFNKNGGRDYETGFTLDMNAPGSSALQNLNLEGRGFSGARNLMKTAVPFGTLHVIECVADSKQKRVRLTLDGRSHGAREFAPAELTADEITVGARLPGDGPDAQPSGFLHGALAEVLLYNRVLNDDETRSVRQYLDQKYTGLKEALPRDLKLAAAAANLVPLVAVTDPPPIQMLLPGFSVYELPFDLPNVNNVRYRADGKMYALCYNGDVYLLSDTDGDGFPDKADLFFNSKGRLRGPIGMAVLPQDHILLGGPDLKPSGSTPQLARAQGIVVASKGKVSAILDKDGDGVAEEEKIIACGWREIPQNVDAIGVAIDPAGAIYFGLGTEAYNNAYLVDKNGKAHYDLQSDRGTIQRIEPDLSKRSVVCTGVRFTIGLAFDEHGELFATDQEGATWLPNGNPFDELLHIRRPSGEKKRHYGFPPMHPKHLPNVFDEPSLFDYAPQHQSTCGMSFNLQRRFSLAEGERFAPPQTTLFGPENWRGNLFLVGESRGKLYRTELARSEPGRYVARNHLIANLNMLTIDCCLAPRGDLIVCCHSGGPDWGTGPTGKGKLFAIRYKDAQAPQPIAAWAAGPQEARVAFDQPLDPTVLKELTAKTSIAYGEFVAAADRFETLRPGYAAVQAQVSSPRYNLPVLGVSVTPDRRTLIIATAPHRSAVQYALSLPGLGRIANNASKTPLPNGENGEKPRPGGGVGELPQHPQIDLAYSLNGVLATWLPDDKAQRGWSGVLPHFDFNLCNGFSMGYDNDVRFREILKRRGTLTLQTQLDLRNLLHPAVQPGSRLDHQWPNEAIGVHFGAAGTRRLQWTVGDKTHEKLFGDEVSTGFSLEFAGAGDATPRITMLIKTGAQDVSPNSIRWFRPAEPAEMRELSLNRFLLPFAETISADVVSPEKREIPELAGGSWGRGRRVFLSEEAGCAKCHVAHGAGGAIGPDLSNLHHRDYASVLRDVMQPSYAINPDYLASVVTLKDGRTLTGVLRTENDKLLIGDKDGRVHKVARGEVDEMRHSPVSIMPEGMVQKLGPERMRDLLTFLLVEPPHMPGDAKLPASKPRTRADVAKVLEGSRTSPRNPRPLRILLVAGAKDHGPGEHDYPAWLRVWSELLRAAEGVTVETAMEWPSPEQFAAADTIAFFQKGSWNAERARAVDAHLAKGRGLVYIHWAVEGGAEAPAFAQRIGLASHAAQIKYRHGPLDLSFESLGAEAGKAHSIGRNFAAVHFHDESYWLLQGDPSKVKVIAAGVEGGRPRPLFWTMEPGIPNAKRQGRVFVSILGHYSATFDDPLFRILLLRGVAWSADEPVDRFNELATIGVKLAE